MRSFRLLRRFAAASIAVSSVVFCVAVADADAATPKLAAGGANTCALLSDGSVKCFGSNENGGVGAQPDYPSNQHVVPTPTRVALAGPAVDIAVGGTHACAVLANGAVQCFGSNGWGTLGMSWDALPHPNPVTVPLPGPATAVDAGAITTCVVLVGGAFNCFGSNRSSTLGRAEGAGVSDDVSPPANTNLPLPAVQSSGGGFARCVVLNNLTLSCFGDSGTGATGPGPVGYAPKAVDLGAPTSQVAVGENHTCARIVDGSLKCFGKNEEGQLGFTADPFPHSTPTIVVLGGFASAVTTGPNHTCTLLDDRSVKCFGLNKYGQLGNPTSVGTVDGVPTPTKVPLAGPAVQVAAGGDHTCALLEDGSVQCFGSNSFGQLGTTTGNSYVPLTVAGLNLIVPPDPKVPAATKIQLKLKRLKLKRKIKGNKLRLSGVFVPSPKLSSATCRGKLALTLKFRGRKLAKKSFALKFKKSKCTAAISLGIPKKYAGKETRLTLAVTSTLLVAVSKTYTQKL